MTEIALQGALDLIAEAGGGTVEGYPHDTTDGKKVSVLYNSTRALYERAGFELPPPEGQAELRDAEDRPLEDYACGMRASSAAPSASRTGSSSIRSSTSWKKPRTISRSASARERPRAIR